jgi:hypothetical protein
VSAKKDLYWIGVNYYLHWQINSILHTFSKSCIFLLHYRCPTKCQKTSYHLDFAALPRQPIASNSGEGVKWTGRWEDCSSASCSHSIRYSNCSDGRALTAVGGALITPEEALIATGEALKVTGKYLISLGGGGGAYF